MSPWKKYTILSEDNAEAQAIAESVFRPVEVERLQERGPFDVKADFTSIQKMTLFQVSSGSGYRARYGCPLHHQIEIHFIETGTFMFRTPDEEMEAFSGSVVLLKDTRKVEIVASPGSSKRVIVVPFDQVAPHLHRAYGSAGRGLIAFEAHMDTGTPGTDIVQQIASHILNEAPPSDQASPGSVPVLLHDALIMTFVSLWPKTDRQRDETSTLPRHLERAIDWLDRHADQDVSVEQLARRSGASIRTLQNSFRHHLSTTPNAYILQTRLSRVHDELLNGSGEETIENIASRWGFGHMGYFAARYRALYGESPSDTRKQRGRAR